MLRDSRPRPPAGLRPAVAATALVSALALSVAALTAQPSTAASAAAETLSVDFSQSTGDFRGGASGTLYGLGDDGVPSQAVLNGAHVTNTSQKPPDGLQHPNGDVLDVEKSSSTPEPARTSSSTSRTCTRTGPTTRASGPGTRTRTASGTTCRSSARSRRRSRPLPHTPKTLSSFPSTSPKGPGTPVTGRHRRTFSWRTGQLRTTPSRACMQSTDSDTPGSVDLAGSTGTRSRARTCWPTARRTTSSPTSSSGTSSAPRTWPPSAATTRSTRPSWQTSACRTSR